MDGGRVRSKIFGKLEHLDSKAVFHLKRAPLHCATDELGVKEICKSKLIKCNWLEAAEI